MKKEGKISKRIILSIFLVIIILIAAIGAAVGLQFKHEIMRMYSEYTYSFTRSAAQFIDGDTVEKYLKTGKKDAYYEEVNKYLNATAEEAGILYFYVFVPNDNDLTYIWDAEPGDTPMELLEKDEYSDENAKIEAKKVLSNNSTEEIKTYVEGNTLVATASSPLLNSKGEPVAIVAADLSVPGLRESFRSMLMGVIVSIVIIMVITMVIYYFVTRRRIIIPITKLTKAISGIVENLENDKEFEDIDIRTNDEIEMLADSFTEMDEKLRNYIRENAEITAEKERIGTELSLATRIQADMLPNVFPPFPERNEFDIYASMDPAKEVGGDFYDFFLVDDSHLAMVMADVSGKGVPAALFMMMSKILLKNQTLTVKSPAKVLEVVNNQICAHNREEMFVTVWLGILDINTGVMTAANAGHEKPIVQKADGNFELFDDKHGFVLGGMEGMKYREYEIKLEKGSKLFVYTDGVVEATNSSNELFGIDRTLEALNNAKSEGAKDILNSVSKSVDEFVGDADQFDDLTMLCLEYIGSDELTIDASIENVETVIDFVSKKADKLNAGPKAKTEIEISVDEIVSNVARYAYGEEKGKVTVGVKNENDCIIITVKDCGVPYNPLDAPEPDVTSSAEERRIGGYGVFIVKKMMDSVEYENKDGINILTMSKKL